MQQAEDFRREAITLAALLEPLDESAFDTRTQFKSWSINDVIGHLYMFDVAALKTLESRAAFADFFAPIAKQMQVGASLVEAQVPWLNGLKGRALFSAWQETASHVADAYATADPKARVAWAGPDMSVKSAITSRQMETWAHGQEIFDTLGAERVESDRIRNICHLGASTYGWTFLNRNLPVPDPAPYVCLTGPSGAVWEWGAPQDANAVQGSAVDFARVVTQVRNIADTDLQMAGKAAQDWMEMAQCFAGVPEDPPKTGVRHIKVR